MHKNVFTFEFKELERLVGYKILPLFGLIISGEEIKVS
jgi:hypothetical protein